MEQRGGQPTRAYTLSTRERAWIIDKLLNAGHDLPVVEACVDRGEWHTLPITKTEIAMYKCASCGVEPFKDSAGRLIIGCSGTCKQKAFADLKDEAVAARAARLREIAREEENTPLMAMGRGEVRPMWQRED